MTPPAFVPLPPLFRAATADHALRAPGRHPSPSPSPSRLARRASFVTPRATATSVPQPQPAAQRPSPVPTGAASPRDVYDFVIVGGGAAGCVLANRLSADGQYRVVLVETGSSSSSMLVNMPLGFPKLLGSSLDAAFTTQPEPHLDGRRLYFPRGRCLGGSHAISVMLYHRGHPHDYDQWAAVAGDAWNPSAVLPYFVRSESQTAPDKRKNTDTHGLDGPLPVSDLRHVNPMSRAFVSAATAQGIGANPDFNDWATDQAGAGLFQVTQQNGNRASPASAYLTPAARRRNLTVLSGTTVERVVFSSAEDGNANDVVATGIEVVDSRGRRVTLHASREVVLSAGVYGSPQLLMLSGIGPAEHLREHGLPVVVDSPAVGANLQDHAAAMLSFHSREPFGVDKDRASVYYSESTGKDPRILADYLLNGRGPLTSPMCEAGAFVRTDPNLPACDLQIRFIPFFSEPDPYGSLAAFANGGTYLKNDANRPAGFSIQSVVARPRSRGRVMLRSVDVRDSMAIHANWIDDNQDLHTLTDGLALCRRIADDTNMATYRGEEIYPGPTKTTRESLEEYVKQTCHTANAMVGTCAMGDDAHAESAVTDPSLNVRGVHRLRVIDSSVMPVLPGGQAGAPTMMLAEKGADMILETARRMNSTTSAAAATRS